MSFINMFEEFKAASEFVEKGIAKVNEEIRLAEKEISALNEGKHIDPVMLRKLVRGAISGSFSMLGYEPMADQVDQLLKESFGMIIDRMERKLQYSWNWDSVRDLVAGYCNGRIVGSEPSCLRVRLEKPTQR